MGNSRSKISSDGKHATISLKSEPSESHCETSAIKYVQITNPTPQHFLLAARIFDDAARTASIEYAIVGGVSAQIFGGTRSTNSLDILIRPRKCGDEYFIEPVIDGLFDQNPYSLTYTKPNRHRHIVVIYENTGVAINFMNSVDNVFEFPALVAETRPDGSHWNNDDPEPTWSYQYVELTGTATVISLPVLHPRLLLQQRVTHFATRPEEKNPMGRKKSDIRDIVAYLSKLYGSEHQSFTDDEAQELLPKVIELLQYTDLYWFQGGLEVDKWRWINIPLTEGAWRNTT